MIPSESAAFDDSLIQAESDKMSDNSELTTATVANDLPEPIEQLLSHQVTSSSDLSLTHSKPPLPKKRRTVSIKHHLKTSTAVINPAVQHPLAVGIEMNGFKENGIETSEKRKIEYQYLCYMLCKEALKSAANEKMLKPLHQFTSEQTSIPPSNIYYMEVIDENPDSTETMKLVSELLLDKPALSIGGYTVVVGDGKTYTHLQKVKSLYGKEMSNLLIYPGDWHLLKNYQQVLFKIYYSAGLKELAEAAGFKGATLKALQNCSNFKHTHHFLLQTWESIYRVMLQKFFMDECYIEGYRVSMKIII